MTKSLGIIVLLLAMLVSACAGGPQAVESGGIPEVYEGVGRDESLLQAMNEAKMDAVRKAVVRLIGAQAEAGNRELLEDVLYNSSNPNRYVFPETMETLRRENLGDVDSFDMIYEIRIRVNLPAVQRVLDANGISAAGSAAESSATAQQSTQGDNAAAAALREDDTEGQEAEVAQERDVTPREREFVRRYVENLSYLVFYDEDSEVDPFLLSTAVGQANSWLASEGYRVFALDQVQELRQDAELVFEEQSGGETGIIRWIAQRLRADIYVEIGASATTRSDGQRHFAQAIMTLRMYETSNGQLLASAPYTSPETISRSSQDDALSNALQSSVFQIMPYATRQSRTQFEQVISGGIRYELHFINTADPRLMSRFRTRLREEMRSLETISQSAEESRYEAFFFGRNDELEDLVYRVADELPGMEFITLVLTRGNTLTFDAGLLQ